MRYPCEQKSLEVVGSNPTTPTIFFLAPDNWSHLFLVFKYATVQFIYLLFGFYLRNSSVVVRFNKTIEDSMLVI